MRVGIHYASFIRSGGPETLTPRLAETARVADQGGAAMFTVMDHWFQMENLGGPVEPMLEDYTTLGLGAAWYEREHLGLGVPFPATSERFERLEDTMIYAGDPVEDVDGFLVRMAEFAAVGIELVTMVPAGDDPVAWTTRACEDVLPRLAGI